MKATTKRDRIEIGLSAAEFLPLDELVRDARLIGIPWRMLAESIYDKSGESVSYQWLINEYPDLNKPVYELVEEAS